MSILADKVEIKFDGEILENCSYSNIKLVQELLKPNELTFILYRHDLKEERDIVKNSFAEELLGKTVELTIRSVREDNREIVHDNLHFKGFVFGINIIKKNYRAGTVIEVIAYSPEYFLCDNPHCISYEEKKLGEIVEETLKPYSKKLDAAVNPSDSMAEAIPYTVQYNETNHNFLRRLAVRYSQWFYYEGETLVFGKVKRVGKEDKEDEALPLRLGNDIENYHYHLNMRFSKPSYNASYNYMENTLNVEDSSNDNVSNENSSALLDAVKNKCEAEYDEAINPIYHSKSDEPEHGGSINENLTQFRELSKQARMLECHLKSIRADLKLGALFNINEEYIDDEGEKCIKTHDDMLIYKITHYSDGRDKYSNEFTAMLNVDTPPYIYTGDHHPTAETQHAVVVDNQDPEKLGRVRVQFDWQKMHENVNNVEEKTMISPWIRIAQPHGGDNKGFYFIPEIDENVMVGFENGNVEKPYVKGTLYHAEQRPGSNWYSDSNDIKAIRTRNGHTIEIHDVSDGGFIQIYDNEKNNYTLTFSTDKKRIKLQAKGNIELYAGNDIIMEAKNDIKMKAGNKMEREAGNDITEKAGNDITVNAGNDIRTEAEKNIYFISGENTQFEAGGDFKTLSKKETYIFSEDNMTIESQKELSVVVGDKMGVEVSKAFELSASEITQVADGKVALEAGSEWTQKAKSTMKIDGGSQLDVKGTMVKIN